MKSKCLKYVQNLLFHDLKAIDFGKMRFLRKSSILQYLKTYTDFERVLICLDVYVGFQDQKLVKNKQKIADLAP